MPVEIRNAAALVVFEGLSITTFNPKKKQSETTYYHDGSHQFSVKIYRPKNESLNIKKPIKIDSDNSGKFKIDEQDYEVVNLSQIWNLETIEPAKDSILEEKDTYSVEIKGIGNPEVKGYEKFEVGDFSRTGGADNHDLRWLVRLEDIHGERLKLKPLKQRKEMKTSTLVIKNAKFFTYQKSDVYYQKINSQTEQIVEKRFGKVCAKIGAIINSDYVSLKIQRNNETFTVKLKKGQQPFIIEIKNNDNSLIDIDTDIYYDLYQLDKDKVRFKLVRPQDGGVGEAPIFCHPLGGDDDGNRGD